MHFGLNCNFCNIHITKVTKITNNILKSRKLYCAFMIRGVLQIKGISYERYYSKENYIVLFIRVVGNLIGKTVVIIQVEGLI